MQPQIKKKDLSGEKEEGEQEGGGGGQEQQKEGEGESGSFPKRKRKGLMLQRRERILGARCSSDLQTEPSLSLAACNPSHGKKLRVGGGGGG